MTKATLEAARAHFPDNVQARKSEKASIHSDLVAATVLLQHLEAQLPREERRDGSARLHDFRQVAAAVRRAQEFTR